VYGPATKISPEALAALEIPDRTTLADVQARGAACLWCASPLTAESVVDLGERRTPDGLLWFPRACPQPCLNDVVHQTLRAHAGMCEQCTDDTDHCETATALRQLVEAHR